MPQTPLIFPGGRAVPPGEVEQVLLGHPAVAEVAVVGVPNQRLGEVVGAAVRLAAPLPTAAADLSWYCRGFVAAHWVPVRWLFTGALPRTPDGELCRATVAAQLAVVVSPRAPRPALVDLADWFRPRPAIEDLRIPRQVRRS